MESRPLVLPRRPSYPRAHGSLPHLYPTSEVLRNPETMKPDLMRQTVLLLIWLVLTAEVFAEDWAQFQGPRGDGTSPETGLLREWPKDGPPVDWRAVIGQGWGAPSVAGNDVVI